MFKLNQVELIDWNTVKELARSQYKIDKSNVVIIDNWSKNRVASWSLSTPKGHSTSQKYFLRLSETIDSNLDLIEGLKSQLGGKTTNRFLACALIKNEIDFMPLELDLKDQVEIEMQRDLLSNLWKVYDLISRKWKSYESNNKLYFTQTSHLMLNLGVDLKNIEKQINQIPAPYSKMEHWFDQFFNFEIVNDELNLSFKEFNSKRI